MKINIGCGSILKKGWINADVRWKRGEKWRKEQEKLGYPSVTWKSACDPWDFDDNVFNYVFSEHMIEHVKASDGLKMLKEAYRTLKSGGVIRIVCPSREFYESLRNKDYDPFVINYMKLIHNREANIGSANHVVNRTLNGQGHLWVPTSKQLIDQIKKAGFKDVKLCEYGISKHKELHNLEVQDELRPAESICVEGTK